MGFGYGSPRMVAHQHTSSAGDGGGSLLPSTKLRLPNNVSLEGRNQADDADIDLLKINTSNRLSLDATVVGLTLGGLQNLNDNNMTSPNLIGGVPFLANWMLNL